MFCRVTTFLCLAIAPVVAQEAKAPKLVEVARTTARGGNCERILLSGDARRMLTVGEARDLLWWDLVERRLLRRVPGRGRYVTAIALHPTEPWALVSTSEEGGQDGSVWRCELDTGETTDLWPEHANAIAFTADGSHVRVQWHVGERQIREVAYRAASVRGKPPFDEIPDAPRALFVETSLAEKADSPDGKRHAECKDREIRCSGAEPRTIRLDAVDTWLIAMAIANDGTVAAADLQGQVHVVAADGSTAVLAGHAGPAHELVFSPDGRFLAVVGLGATRVVDLAGNDVAEWSGTRIVLKGPDGADFWIFDRHDLRRWSASSKRDVVPVIRWEKPTACLVRSFSREPFEFFPDPDPPFRLCTVGTACVVDGVPWLGGESPYSSQPSRLRNGVWEAVREGLNRGLAPAPFALVVCEGRQVFALGSQRDNDPLLGSVSLGEMWSDLGSPAATWRGSKTVYSLACNATTGDVVLGFDDGEVRALAGGTLAEGASRTFMPAPRAMAFFSPDRVLMAIQEKLSLVDAKSLATIAEVDVPGDFERIDVVAVSPTRRHVAMARGTSVRILRVE